jgi:beta-N-acetylhexosaminidase
LSVAPELAALARSVFAVGFTGATVASAPLEALRAFGPGAAIVFARNVGDPDALRALIAALRALDDPAPLVAVDQEGGRVARIGAPLAPWPSMMAFGAIGDPGLCERAGVRLGRELAGLGISVDFAPVADLALERANTVIGTRAFGDDPQVVAALAGAFARGLECGGVAAALKHFPGHGATADDSHVRLPRVPAAEALLRARDLVPFRSAIAANAASLVMTAHVVVDAFDPDRPASLSPRILDGLLRAELGFGGVACTDCLEMDAIARGVGTVGGAVAALAAGADLLLVSHTLATADAAADAIVAAVRAGTLPEERLRTAAARVRALRERFAQPNAARGTDDPDSLDVARRAVTRVRGDVRLRADAPVTVVSFEGVTFDGAAGGLPPPASLSAQLRARRRKSEHMRVALDPETDDVTLLRAHLASLGDREFVVVTRRADLHPTQQAAVAAILAAVPQAIVVSAREPYDALLWPAAQRVLCTYGDDELAFAGCAEVLTGRGDPEGRLPVALDALR